MSGARRAVLAGGLAAFLLLVLFPPVGTWVHEERERPDGSLEETGKYVRVGLAVEHRFLLDDSEMKRGIAMEGGHWKRQKDGTYLWVAPGFVEGAAYFVYYRLDYPRFAFLAFVIAVLTGGGILLMKPRHSREDTMAAERAGQKAGTGGQAPVLAMAEGQQADEGTGRVSAALGDQLSPSGPVPASVTARVASSQQQQDSSKSRSPSVSVGEIESVARLYRRLVLLVGSQLLLGLATMPAQSEPSGPAVLVALVAFVCALGVLIALVVTSYKLMQHLGSSPVLWAAGMIAPCLNLFVLLVISSRTQEYCRRHGIMVGFLGPTKESLERLRETEPGAHSTRSPR